MSKLAAYMAKHERPFTVTEKNGKGEIRILFYPGYITIQSTQPGLHYVQEIHLTRKCWWRLLRRNIIGVSRFMDENFDRYQAERKYYRAEAEHLADQREMKRRLYGSRPRARRRRRRA